MSTTVTCTPGLLVCQVNLYARSTCTPHFSVISALWIRNILFQNLFGFYFLVFFIASQYYKCLTILTIFDGTGTRVNIRKDRENSVKAENIYNENETENRIHAKMERKKTKQKWRLNDRMKSEESIGGKFISRY